MEFPRIGISPLHRLVLLPPRWREVTANGRMSSMELQKLRDLAISMNLTSRSLLRILNRRLLSDTEEELFERRRSRRSRRRPTRRKELLKPAEAHQILSKITHYWPAPVLVAEQRFDSQSILLTCYVRQPDEERLIHSSMGEGFRIAQLSVGSLQHTQGNDRLEVVRVRLESEDAPLTHQDFKKLSGLRYLEVLYGRVTGDFSEILPNLRHLRLFECESVPTDLNMKKLAVLDLRGSHVKDDWRGWKAIQSAGNKLKSINLSHCWKLKRAPDLSPCGSLESINLELCKNMKGGLHIGNFKNLKTLKHSSTKITELIMGDLGMLQCLQVIDAHDTDLIQLPVGIERLSSLEILNLESQFRINLYLMKVPRLPKSLKRLYISSPGGVPNLAELKELEFLCFCSSRNHWIPGGICQLPNLKQMALLNSPCHSLLTTSSPAAALPSSLTHLKVEDCGPLESLPSLSNLNNLLRLKLRDLGVLEIRDLGELRVLETMMISQAPNLENLDGVQNLITLTCLVVESCGVLERLPSLSNLIKLETLAIRKCPVLAEIQGLGDMAAGESLSHLEISSCPRLANVEGLQRLVLQALQDLTLAECGRASDILPLSLANNWTTGVMRRLTYGEELGLSQTGDGEQYLKRFSDISRLSVLEELAIIGCRQLTVVTGLERLVSLELLTIVGCTSITELPDLSGLRNLEKLDVRCCTSLIDAKGIDKLEALQKLLMSDCISIKVLPNLSGLRNLDELDASRCVGLTELKGIEGLESLEKLLMCDCRSLQRLGDLSDLKKLREFEIKGCSQLSEVKGLEKLEGVQDVEMGKRMRVKHLVKSAARYGKGIAARFMVGSTSS